MFEDTTLYEIALAFTTIFIGLGILYFLVALGEYYHKKAKRANV